MLPVCFPFLHWVNICSGCFRQVLFIWESIVVVLDGWSSYKVTIVCEFVRADSGLVVLDEWSSYESGRLNRFDCTPHWTQFLNINDNGFTTSALQILSNPIETSSWPITLLTLSDQYSYFQNFLIFKANFCKPIFCTVLNCCW